MALIYKILILFVVVQFTLFAVFLLNQKKGNKIANKILAAFLFTNALYLIYYPFFSSLSGFLFEYRVHFFRLTEPFRFLFGPLLFLYTVSLTSKVFRLRKKHLWHLLPFLLDCLILLIGYHFQSYEMKSNFIKLGSYYTHSIFRINFFLFYTHFIIYLIGCLIIIKQYQKKLLNFLSSLDKAKLSWLKLIVLVYILIWGIDFLTGLINIKTFSTVFFLSLQIFSSFMIFLLANIMVFRGLQHPDLFIQTQLNDVEKKYKKSPLNQELKNRYLNSLLDYIEREKPYRKFSLTLGELAQKTGIPLNYLSQVINELLNKNFYEFINEYRINEAIKMLSDPGQKGKSMLDILFEVGFNSKSTFYTIFKQSTGMTPYAYKKKLEH